MKKSKSQDPHEEPTTGQQETMNNTPAGEDTATAETTADPVQAVKAELEAKEKDFALLADKYLRLAAEYDNFRRRSQKEKDALYTDSIIMVIKEWLPVLDNLDRAGLAASQFTHEDARKIAEGINLIQKQVEQALTKLGVSRIDSCGQSFNPDLHEAVIHVEDDSVGASTVVEELQKGYCRDDRVIRHSMVKVAN